MIKLKEDADSHNNFSEKQIVCIMTWHVSTQAIISYFKAIDKGFVEYLEELVL